jgi:filamentous hemagglutinin family protein
MSKRTLRLTWIAAACLAHCAAQGQVATDASLGQAAKNLTGPSYQIPQTLGKLAGNNLFHSFQVFSLASGDSANFSTTTPGIQNVVSRVTGGAPSTINGQINYTAADSGRPSFYFVNPAGITFGNGALIDVPGAFHVSTADNVRFADGGAFHADPAKTSSFSSAAPESFGFLGASRAAITVHDNARIFPRIGRTMSLVAGDIVLDGGTAKVLGGDLRVAAAGQQAVQVPVDGALPALAGTVSLSNDSYLQVENFGPLAAGQLSVSTGALLLDYSSIFTVANAGATGGAGAIDIAASSLVLVDNQSTIRTLTEDTVPGGAVRIHAPSVGVSRAGDITSISQGTGAGGAITIEAQDVGIFSEGSIVSSTVGPGTGGAVAVSASNNLLITGADSRIVAFGDGLGQGGSIALAAKDIAITNGGFVLNAAQGRGDGGALAITAQRYLDVSDGLVQTIAHESGAGGALDLTAGSELTLTNSKVAATSVTDGAGGALTLTGGAIALYDGSQVIADGPQRGQAGTLSINTPSSFSMDGASTVLRVSYGRASTASLQVRAGSIDMGDGSEIVNSGLSPGTAGGDIDILATGAIRLHNGSRIINYGFDGGNGGQIRIAGASVTIDGAGRGRNSGVSSGADETDTARNSSAGDITLAASGAVSISKGGYIDSGTFNDAASGNISVTAQDIKIDGGRISNGALNGSGNGGDINITARGNLDLMDHAFISSATQTSGNSGQLRINASNVLVSDGAKLTTGAFLDATGKPGNIIINLPGKLTVTGAGSAIDSSTVAARGAGVILVRAGDILVEKQGGISSFSFERGLGGDAGTVDLLATRQIAVNDGGFVSTTSLSDGDGGAIRMRADSLLVSGGQIRSQAEQNLGNAGSIDVQVTGDLLVNNGGTISSSSVDAGRAGTVQLGARNIGLSGMNSIVTANASDGSIGQTGNLDLVATEAIRISDGARVLMQNFAIVAKPGAVVPGLVHLSAPLVVLDNGIVLTNAPGNIGAGPVSIDSGALYMKDSIISTNAHLGNGGAITINGGKLIVLDNSLITTSVTAGLDGKGGDGGDIRIKADALVLNSGIIQANTAAANASGGLVNIDTQSLVTSGSILFAGGPEPILPAPGVFGLNVIQAAAPTGISGTITINSPVLDVSGSLRGLNAQAIDTGGLGRDPCQASAGSSLVQAGRGGMPVSARGLLGRPGASVVALAEAPLLASLAAGGCR